VQAAADLTIEIYTTPTRTFTSAITPEGPGDEATWSPTPATLIYGDHDAILVDTLATHDQVDARRLRFSPRPLTPPWPGIGSRLTVAFVRIRSTVKVPIEECRNFWQSCPRQDSNLRHTV
jgi:hypothetical protein